MNERFVKSHFLDSGAFSLGRKIPRHQEKFYDSEDFWNYIDSYAAFIKKYKIAIDLYANVDVIGNPELTWRNQKYLEKKHNLNPVPVVHYQTDLKWLEKYIAEGYEIIGLGGLVRKIAKKECKIWLDNCFDIICPRPSRLPVVKIHGFGMTKVGFLFRYPWWSIDATTVEQLSRWGKIMVPRKSKIHRGKYDYKRHYVTIAMSSRVKGHKMSMHFHYLSNQEKKEIEEWIGFINQSNYFNKPLSFKTDDNIEYKRANYFYYNEVCKRIPKWPWPFKVKIRKGLL